MREGEGTTRSATVLAFGAFDAAELVRRHGSPLLVLDCAVLRRQYARLSAALPGVDLFYAVKAFGHEAVLRTLAEAGARFDIASEDEGERLRRLGVGGRRVIHTHPIKKDADIRAGLRLGCTTFVVDNELELAKFVRYRHRVGLLVRVAFPHPEAQVDLSRKFGCAPEEVLPLLARARDLGIRVKGLSFHVGSQVPDATMHVHAVERCAALVARARAEGLGTLSVIDVGGGFPVDYAGDGASIDAFCAPLRTALAALPPEVRVIAEPGRYLVAPAATGVASVVGRAWRGSGEHRRLWYYLDDGVYGSYSGQVFDHTRYPVTVARAEGPVHCSVLAGPTCDSFDVIAEDLNLPEQQVGDLVVTPMMGAYTAASATDFNGMPRAKVLVLGAADVTVLARSA